MSGTCCVNNGFRFIRGLSCPYQIAAVPLFDGGDFSVLYLCSQSVYMLSEFLRQIKPVDAGKSQIVIYLVGIDNLSSADGIFF